jgi:excinuclease ABC subunit C
VTKEEFLHLAPSIPRNPGIYKYYNADDKIIYVGKAKNIYKRVSSYFAKVSEYFKTRKLVSEIVRMEFAVVETEQDALLLENALIKQYQPKYNMMLKDDRSYPHIVIKKEEYPRIFLTRRLLKDGSEYLGPYTSVDQVRSMLELVRQTIPIRSCNLPLTEKNIAKGKFKECLEYHIGNCKAPCIAAQTREEYAWHVNQVRELFKGKLGDMNKYYRQEMMQHVEKMEFEKAEIVKRKINYLKEYQSKSIIVSKKIDNVDVCTIVADEEKAYLNYMVVVQGTIIHTHSVRVDKQLEEKEEEIVSHVLYTLREKFKSHSKEIIVPFLIEFSKDIRLTIPKLGDKKKLIDLSLQNAKSFAQEEKRRASLLLNEKEEESNRLLLQQLQADLKLNQLPIHIECFDNSNFQGAYPVAAMVCFRDGIPSKKDYRHYHIKTVEGINDFASMKEVVSRRYKRLLDEGKSIPQLIIIDGGKGQLSAALESIKELNLLGKTTIVGLAKNIEELFFPGDKESLKLSYRKETLLLLRFIRDEVHRFGISFHRKTRSKGIIKNELTNIEGIGEKTALLLLSTFQSIKKIKQIPQVDIEKVIGKAKASILLAYFEKQNQVMPQPEAKKI